MLGTPHYRLWKIKELRDNAKGQVGFTKMEPNHKVFWVAEEMNWKVLEVGTRQNGVADFPLLVDEQVLLMIIYTVYS